MPEWGDVAATAAGALLIALIPDTPEEAIRRPARPWTLSDSAVAWIRRAGDCLGRDPAPAVRARWHVAPPAKGRGLTVHGLQAGARLYVRDTTSRWLVMHEATHLLANTGDHDGPAFAQVARCR